MKQEAFIFDIDGVVCDSYRPEFEEQFKNGYYADFEKGILTYPSISWATKLIKSLHSSGYHIIFMTARNASYRRDTEEWLRLHTQLKQEDYSLYMRPYHNTDSDSDLKRHLTLNIIDRYNILAAFDDKLRNVLMWQDMDIYALHVLT